MYKNEYGFRFILYSFKHTGDHKIPGHSALLLSLISVILAVAEFLEIYFDF
jgi:hypothetical protein